MNRTFLMKLSEIRWKPILVPPEHGIWGFTIEALILGLFLTEEKTSYVIAITMLLLPFAKQSFKIMMQDIILKRTFLRKYIAILVNIFFVSIFLFIFYYIHQNAIYFYWIFPFILAFLLGAILVILEIKEYYQHLLVEMIGSFIPLLFAFSMHLTHERQNEILLFMFMIITFRNITSILLIREIVAKIKKQNFNSYIFYATLLIAAAFALFFNSNYLISKEMIIIMYLYLLIFLMLFHKSPKKLQTLGWIQIVVGLLYIFSFVMMFKYHQ